MQEGDRVVVVSSPIPGLTPWDTGYIGTVIKVYPNELVAVAYDDCPSQLWFRDEKYLAPVLEV